VAQAGKSRKNEMDVSFAKNIELNDTGGYTDIYIYSMYIYITMYTYIYIYIWLVVWNMAFIFPYLGKNNPN